MPKVGIVIVNYNGGAYQNECIRSLYEMDYRDFEIIVVDNASQDNSVEKLKNEFPKVHILEQNQNQGFAKGSNIGADFSIYSLKTEYTLLINSDTIVDKGLLRNLVEASKERYVSAPKIYYYKPDNVLWFAGGELDWKKGNARHIGIHEADNGQYDERKIISFVTGCCMLIPNRLIEQYGLFHEKYFMYCEDLDLCAKWQKSGVEIVYEPKARLWHKVSSSSGGDSSELSTYYMFRNQLYFMGRYKDRIDFMSKMYVFIRALIKLMISPFVNKNNKAIFCAYKDYLNGKMGIKAG